MIGNGRIFSNAPDTASPGKPQGLLSSLFSGSDSGSVKGGIFMGRGAADKSTTSPTSGGKPQGLLNSVLGTNYRILTGLSSKLEAALSFSFDVLDSDSSHNENSSVIESPKSDLSPGKKHLMQLKIDGSECSVNEKVQRWKESSKVSKRVFGRHSGVKNRSVYGQPEITSVGEKQKKPYTKREPSRDSLDTLDSGHSLENSSCHSNEQENTSKTDPFFVFRHKDSVGIGSESDTCGPSTSVDSSDAESIHEIIVRHRSGSDGSMHSWTSSLSGDSQSEDALELVMKFMSSFVDKIFKDNISITFEEKAKFGELCRLEDGRLWFSRYVNTQRINNKQVNESTFYSLVQYFAIVLFECAEADDFSPAKNLMNMCFTFFHEVREDGCTRKEYLYKYLKEQSIWKSLRFWNAAFFDAVQCERAHKPTPTRSDMSRYSLEDMQDEQSFQENITFGQLGTFTHNMHAFGLSKEFCLEFLRKQCTIANLPPTQMQVLRENIEHLYRGYP